MIRSRLSAEHHILTFHIFRNQHELLSFELGSFHGFLECISCFWRNGIPEKTAHKWPLNDGDV